MLRHPDFVLSASVNCWIVYILTFHFTLVHVPGTQHRPDGLSRRPLQPEDNPEEDDIMESEEEWMDNIPVVAEVATLFSRIYCDTMKLPKSGGFTGLASARCATSAVRIGKCIGTA
ncbi:hypothetical protein HGRIS_012010 [Hohenbuehelia grisea]|uniref:Uncharacterized protein n=1 Tax=Hohenbuehelia grisea TaxID=104357 RepID=A0ABR3IP34_9AGAR